MKKVALVVHRYGTEIGSGAEYLAMQYVANLKKFYDVDVLTTTCLDYNTWANYYPRGETEINGTKVIRFPTTQLRQTVEFGRLCQRQLKRINAGEPTELKYDKKWIQAQGPCCPELIDYIDKHRKDYDVFIFITYIYYHSVLGIPLVANKSIFIPTAHDEPWIRQSIYKNLFGIPRYFCFLTEEEKQFVQGLFHNYFIKGDVVGTGVKVPEKVNPENFKRQYRVESPYMVYVGRVDASKRCDELITYFIHYKKNHSADLKLVLIGTVAMEIPARDDIISTGFVDEQMKYDCIAGASFMIAPSEYESLCIALLEGFALGIPALVNARCSVLRGHCDKSGAGLYYTCQQEFSEYTTRLLIASNDNSDMKENALQYINRQYTWDYVIKKLCNAIEYVTTFMPAFHNGEYAGRDIYNDGQLDAVVLDSDKAVIPAYKDGVAILCVSSDFFGCFLEVLVYSIIHNASLNRNYDIVILIDDMSHNNMNQISSMAHGRDNITIRFVDVSTLVGMIDSNKIEANYNRYTYYRLFLLSFMADYDKVLYLDSDIAVNADVSLLYDTDISGFYLAATYDALIASWQSYPNEMRDYFKSIGLNKPGEYIQAGVILFNVKEISAKYSQNEIMEAAIARKYIFHDQDLLNVLYKGKIKYIGQEWNVFHLRPESADLINRFLPQRLYDECMEARKHPKIIHYPEQRFPCYVPDGDMGTLYWKYARNTPCYEKLIHILIRSSVPAQQLGEPTPPAQPSTRTSSGPIGLMKRIYRKIRRMLHGHI
ncbi:MAG: glycosyltransferase [Firmicutes bacterium]|nr:glycosyltransferase [Bacillota bacterium]